MLKSTSLLGPAKLFATLAFTSWDFLGLWCREVPTWFALSSSMSSCFSSILGWRLQNTEIASTVNIQQPLKSNTHSFAGGTNCRSPELDNILPQNPRCTKFEAEDRVCNPGSDKKSLLKYKNCNAVIDAKGGMTSAIRCVPSRFRFSRYLRFSNSDIDNISTGSSVWTNPT